MDRHRTYGVIVFAAALSAAGLSGLPAASAWGAAAPLRVAAACEGEACAQVTLTFDEARQQYRVQNNSSDRWARVTASNLAGSAAACVGPGKAEYLPLSSIVGAYRAEPAEPRCGAAGTE